MQTALRPSFTVSQVELPVRTPILASRWTELEIYTVQRPGEAREAVPYLSWLARVRNGSSVFFTHLLEVQTEKTLTMGSSWGWMAICTAPPTTEVQREAAWSSGSSRQAIAIAASGRKPSSTHSQEAQTEEILPDLWSRMRRAICTARPNMVDHRAMVPCLISIRTTMRPCFIALRSELAVQSPRQG